MKFVIKDGYLNIVLMLSQVLNFLDFLMLAVPEHCSGLFFSPTLIKGKKNKVRSYEPQPTDKCELRRFTLQLIKLNNFYKKK